MTEEGQINNTSNPENIKESPPPVPIGKTGRIIIGVCLIIIAFLLGYLLFAIWSATAQLDAEGEITKHTLSLFGSSTDISTEVKVILLVMITGLLGSYIHTTISFVNFAGNRKLVRSWLWYYATRPFVGPFLALIFYFILRGGMLSGNVGAEEINQYGILAVSGLAGLFSKQALEKLEEIFRNLFKTKEPDQLQDKITNSDS